MSKKSIMFIDGNNWYHNVKSIIEKPRKIDFKKLANEIEKKFDLKIQHVNYYNSVPDIETGEEVYYKHMIFLAKLKQKGLGVKTAKLKKIKSNGKMLRVEKGVDVMIAVDMISMALLEKKCECCILVSGDSDFVPVIRLIKAAGKEVLTVSPLKGYARELLQGEFRFWILKKNDLKKCLTYEENGK